MRSGRRKKTHTLFFNNSKVKVRLVTLLFSLFVLVYGSTVCKDTFFSETLVVLYVKNN